jgi:hypothetical protein
MKKLTRKDAVKLIAAVFVLASFTLWAFYPKTQKETAKETLYKAEMTLASGSVEKFQENATWVKLNANDQVAENETVRVSGEGKAIITLDDGSAIRLNSNSVVNLQSLNPNNIEVINISGEIYTRVVKADRSFVVKVDDESYTAMGTAYKTINTNDVKGVLVYESKVKNKEQTEVPEGKKLYKKYESQKDNVNKLLDIAKEEIEKDTFTQWNKEEDLKNEEHKKYLGVLNTKTEPETATPAPITPTTPPKTTAPTTPTASIKLTGSATDKGINLGWVVTNVDTSKGFKLVKSTEVNPVYPGNSAAYLNPGTTSYSISLTDGKTYHFRVCQYTGASCGVYSNDIVVTAPKVADGVVSKIELFSYATNQVKWYITGLSDLGVKVVWSKTSGPTYPTRATDKYHYYGDTATYKIDTLDAFDGPGTYYVRVCEYLGGSCGVYSNEIQINL